MSLWPWVKGFISVEGPVVFFCFWGGRFWKEWSLWMLEINLSFRQWNTASTYFVDHNALFSAMTPDFLSEIHGNRHSGPRCWMRTIRWRKRSSSRHFVGLLWDGKGLESMLKMGNTWQNIWFYGKHVDLSGTCSGENMGKLCSIYNLVWQKVVEPAQNEG
jgi:hypothetical protein